KTHMSYNKLSSRIDLYILLVVVNHNRFADQARRDTVKSSFYFNTSVNIHFTDTYRKKYKRMFRQRPKPGTFYITEKFPHLATGGSVYTGTCPSFIPITQVCICFRKAVELLAVKSIVFCVTDIPFYNTFMFRSARYAGVCCKIPVHCELQVCFIKDR